MSIANVEDTQSASLGLLQLLHEHYGVEQCHVEKDTSIQKSASL
jgi:hypothetical protein